MRHYACPQTFIKENINELKSLSVKVCNKYGHKDHTDVLNDVVLKIYTRKILKDHDPKRGSLYNHLFTITKNATLSTLEHERRFLHMTLPETSSDDTNEADYAIQKASPKYLNMLHRNQYSSSQIGSDLAHFRRLLASTGMNKKHNLSRRKDKTIQPEPLTLLKLFDMLLVGYTCHEIAVLYGTSDMAISHCKTELRIIMEKNGILP